MLWDSRTNTDLGFNWMVLKKRAESGLTTTAIRIILPSYLKYFKETVNPSRKVYSEQLIADPEANYALHTYIDALRHRF